MLRKDVTSIVLMVLALSLIVPLATFAETLGETPLPDATYLAVVECGEGIYSTQSYIKDGKMYLEIAGQLYAMDAFQEKILTMANDTLEEAMDAVEIREIGEEMLDGHRTMHYQFFSKKTGLLELENWQALDLPLPLAIKSISYDPKGNVVSTTRIIDIEFEPDFNDLNFSNTLPFGVGPQRVSLTFEEFKEMVPWYDISLQPLRGHKLIEIECVATLSSLRFILTYSIDTADQIQVMILGDRDRLAETHGPSEFELLSRIKFGEFTLEPAIRSGRTNVMVGLFGSISRSDGNIFLQNVIIHPTLQ